VQGITEFYYRAANESSGIRKCKIPRSFKRIKYEFKHEIAHTKGVNY